MEGLDIPRRYGLPPRSLAAPCRLGLGPLDRHTVDKRERCNANVAAAFLAAGGATGLGKIIEKIPEGSVRCTWPSAGVVSESASTSRRGVLTISSSCLGGVASFCSPLCG